MNCLRLVVIGWLASAGVAHATYFPDGDASGGNVTTTGGVTARTAATRGADVFNFADGYGAIPGAKCDGTTNDDAAINATLTAAFNSVAYQNNNAVTITGPSGGLQKGCLMNSLNFTQFNKGTGANTRPRVTFRDVTLLCTGARNVCIDGLGANFVKLQNVSIRGDSAPNTPEICIQFGIINGVSSAWNTTDHVNCNNAFAFTALYNMGSEANTYTDSFFVNANSINGPIGSLGSITGGSAYTNGTYSSVPLTGGTGSGALARIVVSGGAVTAITVPYEGRDYVPGDTLSVDPATALGGTGSGFSIPVSTISPYAAIIDGQNHWRATSAFVTETLAADTWASLTLVTFQTSHVRQLGTGGSLWLAWTSGFHMINSYVLNNTGTSCVNLYNSGVTKSGIPNQNNGIKLDISCEGAVSYMVFLTGANATPVLRNLKLESAHGGSVATFGTDTSIISATLANANISLDYELPAGVPMFSKAKIWNVTGRVALPAPEGWNAPASFQGELLLANIATPPGIGPIDILPGASQAVSCARLLSNSYTGPLCQLQRASDSVALDIYPTGSGSIDRNAVTTFCNGTTCTVSVMYDQSGNANNFTQTTAASQPALSLSTAALGGRAALLFGDGTAIAMTAAASASINDIFSTAGYVSMVVDQTVASASQTDRVLFKNNNGSVGFDLRVNTGGSSLLFKQGATTTSGTWSSVAPGAGAWVQDLQYSSALLANSPSFATNGTTGSAGSSTQPVGTVSSDAALPLLLGNNLVTGGFTGYPGYIAESVIWKATPTAPQLEAIRRNQAAYYGVANVN